jgi:hypothetical protein
MGANGLIERGQERLTEKFIKISCDCGNEYEHRAYPSDSRAGFGQCFKRLSQEPPQNQEYQMYGISAELIELTVEYSNDQLISLTTRYANG